MCAPWPYVTQYNNNNDEQVIIPLTWNHTSTCRLYNTEKRILMGAQFQDSTSRQVMSLSNAMDVCSMLTVQSDFEGANLCTDLLGGAVDVATPTFIMDYSNDLARSAEWNNVLLVVTMVEYTLSMPCRRGDVAKYGQECCYTVSWASKTVNPEIRRCDGNRCLSRNGFCDGVPTCLDGSDEGLWCTPFWVWGYVGAGGLFVLVGLPVIVVCVVRSRRSKMDGGTTKGA